MFLEVAPRACPRAQWRNALVGLEWYRGLLMCRRPETDLTVILVEVLEVARCGWDDL